MYLTAMESNVARSILRELKTPVQLKYESQHHLWIVRGNNTSVQKLDRSVGKRHLRKGNLSSSSKIDSGIDVAGFSEIHICKY